MRQPPRFTYELTIASDGCTWSRMYPDGYEICFRSDIVTMLKTLIDNYVNWSEMKIFVRLNIGGIKISPKHLTQDYDQT